MDARIGIFVANTTKLDGAAFYFGTGEFNGLIVG